MAQQRSAPASSQAGVSSLHWRRDDLAPDDWRIELPEPCMAELERIAITVDGHAGPLTEMALAGLDLPGLRRVMAEARERLAHGRGFVVLDRVPVERWPTRQNQGIGWILANLIGRVVAQKQDGTRLYDVRDSGKALAHGVRRSITNLEQQFHTDGGWLGRTPAQVGLFCIRPAAAGGASRLASLLTIHEALGAEPELLARLYRPFCWDRQAEHAAGDTPFSRAPVYWRDGDQVLARYYDDYVLKGQELAGESLDGAGAAALEAMRRSIEAEANGFELQLRAGQFLYVDNRRIAHSRTAFQDDQAKRHLMRFWNRDDGSADLEG